MFFIRYVGFIVRSLLFFALPREVLFLKKKNLRRREEDCLCCLPAIASFLPGPLSLSFVLGLVPRDNRSFGILSFWRFFFAVKKRAKTEEGERYEERKKSDEASSSPAPPSFVLLPRLSVGSLPFSFFGLGLALTVVSSFFFASLPAPSCQLCQEEEEGRSAVRLFEEENRQETARMRSAVFFRLGPSLQRLFASSQPPFLCIRQTTNQILRRKSSFFLSFLFPLP